MFDTVTFRYRMPDGETGPEYQTKDLDCECAFYEISAEGRLLRWPDDADELTGTGFDGCITVCARRCYHLYFKGQLEWIESCSGGGRWPFDPAHYLVMQG
jgi:hypothetical protein